jgi:hypothetical protein
MIKIGIRIGNNNDSYLLDDIKGFMFFDYYSASLIQHIKI